MDEDFEFDPAKSAANHDKHGIDFVEAQGLWRVSAFDRASPFVTEPRRLRTGQLEGRFWTGVYTFRGDIIRLISARRARAEEITGYDQYFAERTGTDQEP